MGNQRNLRLKGRSTGIDFKKVKSKVGRKLAKPENETRTSFKSKQISLPQQSVSQPSATGPSSFRGKPLKELLSLTEHHSERARLEALLGLRELLCAHPRAVGESTAALLDRVGARLCDLDKKVRETARAVLQDALFPALPPRTLAPFFAGLMAHVCCAMTHLAPPIRASALPTLDLLLHTYPHLTLAYQHQILSHFADLLSQRGPAARSAPAVAPVLQSLLHLGLASLSCTSSGGPSPASSLLSQPHGQGAQGAKAPANAGAARRDSNAGRPSAVAGGATAPGGSGVDGNGAVSGRAWEEGEDSLLSLAQCDEIDAMILRSAKSSLSSMDRRTSSGAGRDSSGSGAREVAPRGSRGGGAAPVVDHSWAPGAFFAQEGKVSQEASGEPLRGARQVVWGRASGASPNQSATHLAQAHSQGQRALMRQEEDTEHRGGEEGEGNGECSIGFLPQGLFGLVLSDLHERAGMAVGRSSSQGGGGGGGDVGSREGGRGGGMSDSAAVACVTTALKILMLCCAQSQRSGEEEQESLNIFQTPSDDCSTPALPPLTSSKPPLAHHTSTAQDRADSLFSRGSSDTLPPKERQALLRTVLSRCAFPLSAPPGASSPSALQPLAEVNVLCAQLLTLLLRAPPPAPPSAPLPHRQPFTAQPGPAYPVRYTVQQSAQGVYAPQHLVSQPPPLVAPQWLESPDTQQLLQHVHMRAAQRGSQRPGHGQGQGEVESARACDLLLRYLGQALGGQVLPGQGNTVSGALSGPFLSDAVRRLLFCVPRAAALAASLAVATPPFGSHEPGCQLANCEAPGCQGAPRLTSQDPEWDREGTAGASSAVGGASKAQLRPLLSSLLHLLWSAQPLGGPTTAACLAAMQALLLHPWQHQGMQGARRTPGLGQAQGAHNARSSHQRGEDGAQGLAEQRPPHEGPQGVGSQGRGGGWAQCLVPEDVWCQWLRELPKLLWELRAQKPQLSHAILRLLHSLACCPPPSPAPTAGTPSLREAPHASGEPRPSEASGTPAGAPEALAALPSLLTPFFAVILPTPPPRQPRAHKGGKKRGASLAGEDEGATQPQRPAAPLPPTLIFGPFLFLPPGTQSLALSLLSLLPSAPRPLLRSLALLCLVLPPAHQGRAAQAVETAQGMYERRTLSLEDLLSFLVTLLVGQTSDVSRADVAHHRMALFGAPTGAPCAPQTVVGAPGPAPSGPKAEATGQGSRALPRASKPSQDAGRKVGAVSAEEEVSGLTAATGPGGEAGEEADTGAKGVGGEETAEEGEKLQKEEEEERGLEGDWEGGEEEWGEWEEERGELLGAVCSALASLGEGDSLLRILAAPISDALHPWPGAQTVHSILAAVLVCCQPLRSDAQRHNSEAPSQAQPAAGTPPGIPAEPLVPGQCAGSGADGGPEEGAEPGDGGMGTGVGTPPVDPSELGFAPQDFCPPLLQLSLGRAAARLCFALAKVHLGRRAAGGAAVHPSVLTDSLAAQPQLRVVSALLSLSPGMMEALLGSFLEAAHQPSGKGPRPEGLTGAGRLPGVRRRNAGPRLVEAVALVLSSLHVHPQLTWQLSTPRLRQWEGAIVDVLQGAADTPASEGSVLPSLVQHLRLCVEGGGQE